MSHPPGPMPQAQAGAVELARRAFAAMAASFAPCPEHLIPSFRLWHYPPAGRQVSWVIFHGSIEDPQSGVPIARRVDWDRDGDLERLELARRRRPSLEPTLAITEGGLDAPRLARLMDEASGLGLPRDRLVRPYLTDHRAEFGLEGFDLEGRDGRPIVRIEWDRIPPLQLEGVAGWATRVRHWLARVQP